MFALQRKVTVIVIVGVLAAVGSALWFYESGRLLLVLDPPADPAYGVNLVVDPSLEAGTDGVISHQLGVTDSVFERTDADATAKWPSDGSYSLHMGGVSKTGLLDEALRGFVGAYLLPADAGSWRCAEGREFTVTADARVRTAPTAEYDGAASPGLWLELFFYRAEGLRTAVVQQTNSATFQEPVTNGVHHLTHTAVCPAGADMVQAVAVMATAAPNDPMEWWLDNVSVTAADH